MSARHPQVRQSEQCHQLRRVFGQAAKAHLGVTELALDYPERMLDLGAHLSLGLFNLALGFVQHAALIEFFVGAAACRHLPDNFTSFMLGPLFDTGVACIGADHVFVAMQQFVHLGDIRHIGRRAHYAVHQTRFVIGADVGLHAKIILVSLLGLVHFRVALAVLVLGRTGRIDQRCIDDGALAQRQAAVAQIAIDDSEDAGRQLVFLQQAAEVENGGFVGDALQVQPGKLAQDRGFVQRFLHRWIAVAEPVLQQMHTQHRHQRVGRTATFTFRIMWLDQSNQALPRHHPIHLDQEQLLAGLLALASVLGVGEGHLLHRETRWVGSRYFAKSESLFQSFPRVMTQRWVRLDSRDDQLTYRSVERRYGDLRHIKQRYLEGDDNWLQGGKSWHWQPETPDVAYEYKDVKK